MAAQQQPHLTPAITAKSFTEINGMLDTLNENMFNLLHAIVARAELDGWGSRLVRDGLDKIDDMKKEVKRLEEERRQLYAATTALAS